MVGNAEQARGVGRHDFLYASGFDARLSAFLLGNNPSLNALINRRDREEYHDRKKGEHPEFDRARLSSLAEFLAFDPRGRSVRDNVPRDRAFYESFFGKLKSLGLVLPDLNVEIDSLERLAKTVVDYVDSRVHVYERVYHNHLVANCSGAHL